MKFWKQMLRLTLWLGAAALAACGPGKPTDPAQANWLTNPEQAMALSRQQGRPMFIAFFGSDWSVASQDALKNVFDTQAFKDFADGNLVLLKLDFPRKGMSPALEKSYGDLAKGLQVDHFPVFYLADPANGVGPFQRLPSTGNGGPLDFVGQLSSVLAEYRAQLATQRAKILQAQTTTVGSPPPASQAGVKSGFPSPDELLHQSQSQPAPPNPGANPAPAGNTSAPMIHLQ
jgi:hypothetical protein